MIQYTDGTQREQAANAGEKALVIGHTAISALVNCRRRSKKSVSCQNERKAMGTEEYIDKLRKLDRKRSHICEGRSTTSSTQLNAARINLAD